MTSETKELIERISDADWFEKCGDPVDAAVATVMTWSEAVQYCADEKWESICAEESNRIGSVVRAHSHERFNKWNDVANAVRPIVNDLLRRECASAMAKQALPKVFMDTVRWDIIHALLETEYADIYPPSFFATQAEWYCSGRFPCGWLGDHPEGKLIVF